MNIPKFQDIIGIAEARLSVALGGVCKILVIHDLPSDVFQILMQMEEMKFREELRYTKESLIKSSKDPGFTCILLSLDGKLIAYDIGKDDDEMGSYYSETTVTIIERKGIGAILTVLEFFYSYENGYKFTNQQTEEIDQERRRLRQYWEKFGYKVYKIIERERFDNTKPALNMRVELTPELLITLYNKYLA